MPFNVKRFAELKSNFGVVCSRINRANASKNAKKIKNNEEELIVIYNSIIRLYKEFFDSNNDVSEHVGEKLLDNLNTIRADLKRCLDKLNSIIIIPDDNLQEIQRKKENKLKPDNLNENKNNSRIIEHFGGNDIHNSSHQVNKNTMTTNIEFLKFAAQQIHKNYAGEPLGLSAFVDQVKLIAEIKTAAQNDLFKRFVLSKLEGKAKELIPADVENVDAILTILTNSIKPDNSKIIEGRILALKFNFNKAQEFSQELESLSEAFQRSLIIEGIPMAKAKSMAIEKTVETCRLAARSELVKSVLASSSFVEPKEAIAKFLIESNTETKEKQILAFKTAQSSNRGRGRGGRFSHRNQNNWGNGQRYDNKNQQGRGRGNYRGRRGRGNWRGNRNGGAQVFVAQENQQAPPSGVQIGQADCD